MKHEFLSRRANIRVAIFIRSLFPIDCFMVVSLQLFLYVVLHNQSHVSLQEGRSMTV